MSRTWEILFDLFWLVIILGGGGWLFIRSLKASEDPGRIVFKWLITIPLVVGEIFLARHYIKSLHVGGMLDNFPAVFILVVSVAACCVVVAIIWGENIGNIAAKPLTSLFDGGDKPPEPKPFYSIALSKRKAAKPLEAIVEIRRQLAQFPDDYEGVALLAAIQAEDTSDLVSAQFTLEHFCAQPKSPPLQVAAALTQLADWHLKLAQDVENARLTLEKIIARFPGTPLALAAAQRIAHLGGTEKILLAAQDRQAMTMPEGVKNVGLLDSSAHLAPADADPAQLAQEYLKHLQQYPHDTDIREKLALIYSDHYQRLDLAAIELEQLINQDGQPAKLVAQWLNRLADLQVKHGAELATVQVTLQRIVDRFPRLPAAALAEARLARLALEFKGKKETPGKKLGVYEQNLGLKYGRSRY